MHKQRPGADPRQRGRATSTGPDMRQIGLRHFQAGRFDQAINAWQPLAGDPQVGAALAEAYFRRAMATSDAKSQADDLRLAVAASPDDPRLHYHLGLALHRQGDLAGAQVHYAIVAAA